MLTSFIEDNRQEVIGVLEESKEDANFWHGIVGTTWWIMKYVRRRGVSTSYDRVFRGEIWDRD